MNREIKIPKKIEKCPIIEAMLEFRFKTNFPSDAIFGIIYSKIKHYFPKVESLPILQIPEKVRTQDPNLMYQPCYKLCRENFILQIGPKSISFVNIEKYLGWEILEENIKKYFDQIFSLEFIDKFERMGLRYVNFFEPKNFKHVTLKAKLNEIPFDAKQINIQAVIDSGKFKSNITVINKAKVLIKKSAIEGSIIDIDTYFDSAFSHDNALSLANEAHKEENIIFFNLLEDEYVKTLNPEY